MSQTRGRKAYLISERPNTNLSNVFNYFCFHCFSWFVKCILLSKNRIAKLKNKGSNTNFCKKKLQHLHGSTSYWICLTMNSIFSQSWPGHFAECFISNIWLLLGLIHQIFLLTSNQSKLRKIKENPTIFKTVRFAKKIWRITNTISIWRQNVLRYLSLDIICSSELTLKIASQNR